MDLEMVLNELSLYPLATNTYDARKRMSVLIHTIIKATKSGVQKTLRTSSNFATEALAPNYPVAKWLNDGEVDREARRFFRSIITKAPLLVDITVSEILENFSLSDYFWQEKPAAGLGVAFLLDALALSLSSDPCWLESHIQLKISQLGDDEVITDVFENIPHASTLDHVQIHLPWINSRLRTNIHEGLDIYSQSKVLFPHIFLGKDLKDQLQALQRSHIMLRPILKRLYELEEYCCNWLDGPFDPTQIVSKTTPESTAALEMYSAEHTFRDHNGIPRIFNWHMRLTPSAWRLYFYTLPDEHALSIGYIGKHLPTKLYSH